MSKQLVTILGKTVRHISKIKGGGTALPGLVVEKISPNFLKETLSKTPLGVVVVSGTNGKTTTTKIIVELLQSQGLKVFSNKTGSNFTRGVVAALLKDIDIKGNLDADIAVLELDEAHAVHFVNAVKPKYCLLLNVMRDQLDRFGEIDYTANLLRHIAESTSKKIIINREDPRLATIAQSFDDSKVEYFGYDKKLASTFPNDDEIRQKATKTESKLIANVELLNLTKTKVNYKIDGDKFSTSLKLNGIYNAYNAAAALATVRAVLGKNVKSTELISALSTIEPAFGRGESFIINNQPVELILIKNPAGFRLGLKSFNPKNYQTMIAINDNYADGRDMSWLWDVDFSSLAESGIFITSGTRAYDIALRLKYDDINIKHTIINLSRALKLFISDKSSPKRIYCTYTAMLKIRSELQKISKKGINNEK